MIKKIFFITVILGGYLFCWPENVLAQADQINFSANVLEKKTTDTMNDFNYNNQDYTRPSFKAILGVSTDTPATPIEPPKIEYRFHWQDLLLLSPIYGSYYLLINLLQ